MPLWYGLGLLLLVVEAVVRRNEQSFGCLLLRV